MLVSRKQDWMVQDEIVVPSLPTKSTPKVNKNLRSKCLILAATLAVMAMAVTLQSEYIVRSGYNLVQLKAQAAKLEKENELLRLDIAKLKSPQRIQQIATSQLGMVMPQTVLYASSIGQSSPEVASGQSKTITDKVVGIFKAGTAEASKGR
ncbi:septum formation initiator family protein [Anaerospora sp.]|uniref:septum formation initiator family protein n=1 Tax=Anaerospora sp. TaxID=1960278 RepID=UPI002896FF30|nr:cell division protein FtsL [Anaerospora sp.]MDF2928039.1 ftsL 1 [Anaerospora sp.]